MIPLSPQVVEQIRQRLKKAGTYTDSALIEQLLYDDFPAVLAEIERLQGLLDQQTQELERFRLQQRIVVETGSQFGQKTLPASEERDTP